MRSAMAALLLAAAANAAPARWGSDPLASATAGTALRESSSAFAAANNPALVGVEEVAAFGFAMHSSSFRWNSMGNVVVDSPEFRVEDGRLRRADLTPEASSMTALAVGVRVPIRSRVRWLPEMGIGVSATGPLSTLRSFRASTPYDFAPLRYGGPEQQFKATVGASATLIAKHLYFGAGLDVFITAGGNADVAVGGNEPVGRFAMDVGWNTAAVVGAFWKSEATSAALTYRQRIHPKLRQQFLGAVQLGGIDVAAIPLELEATLYGEPETFEAEFGQRLGKFTLAAGLRWERWNGVQTSALKVRATMAKGEHRATRENLVALNDTVSPAVSLRFAPNDDWTLSTGYRFSPSPVADRSGATNVLDAGTHVWGLGVSQRIGVGSIIPCPLRWSLSLQRHWTDTLSVTKTRADAIGAPGYILSGGGFGVQGAIELQL